MSFLKEQMLPAKTSSNLEEPGSQEETFVELSFIEDDPSSEPVASVSTLEPAPKKQRTNTDLKRKMLQVEENKFGLMQAMMTTNEELEFFKSLVPYIMPLDKLTKLRLRQNMKELFFEAVADFEADN
ncbi:hypothetical protein FKM82_030033 [Ascaphus truei]